MAGEALSVHLALMLKDGDKLPEPLSMGKARDLDIAGAKEGGYEYNQDTVYQVIVADFKARR